MKKIIYFILLVCTAFACTDETSVDPGGKKPIEVPEGMSALKLNFKGLGRTQSYATNLTGTEAENRVDSVHILLFDAKKKDTLVNVYTIIAPDYGIGGITGTEATLLVSEKSEEMNLIAIANPADSVVTNDWMPYIGVIDYADFQKMTTLPSDSMPKPGLLMSAMQNGGVVSIGHGDVQTATFDLIRSVARIDILNRDSVGVMHEFVLEKARLNKIPSTTYLHGDGRTTPDNAKLLTNLNWVHLDDSDGSTGTMFSQLYMYPSDGKDVELIISGKYNGAEAQYPIPFNSKQILANHRYVVAIDSINPTTVYFNIRVADWDSDTIKFDPDGGIAPEVKLPDVLPTGITLIAGENGKPDTLSSTHTTKVIEIEVRSETVEPDFSTAAEWITVKAENAISYSDIGFAKKYTIQIDSTLYEREGIISFVNPIKPTERVVYCIAQQNGGISDTPNPLTKFAKANLMIDYTIGADLTPETAGRQENYGAWFQWGRKTAFENNNTNITTVDTKIPFANGVNTEGSFIGEAMVWHTETGNAADIWTKLSGGSTIDNDPCPDGYKMPSADEWLRVSPPTGDEGNYTNAVLKIKTSPELTGNQITSGLTGNTYYRGSSLESDKIKIVYGIKQNNTNDAYALRWRYIGNSIFDKTYLEVTVIKIGKGFVATAATTVIDFTNLPWETTASEAKREVRFFPAAGYRHYSGGTPSSRGSYGYYWLSSANNADRGWYLCFNASNARLNSDNRAYGLSVRCVTE